MKLIIEAIKTEIKELAKRREGILKQKNELLAGLIHIDEEIHALTKTKDNVQKRIGNMNLKLQEHRNTETIAERGIRAIQNMEEVGLSFELPSLPMTPETSEPVVKTMKLEEFGLKEPTTQYTKLGVKENVANDILLEFAGKTIAKIELDNIVCKNHRISNMDSLWSMRSYYLRYLDDMGHLESREVKKVTFKKQNWKTVDAKNRSMDRIVDDQESNPKQVRL